ncbi:hypothetical protein LEP1GSC083_2805 [Leptospira interrogans serovar Pyrogenes str. L0374]|uniref:Uncharacterized protein n=2 Tax=Leptospira interrogans serovar Pyrogenes TaxID=280500 RepID=M7A6L9_LEPIR|nr:hypothetical protein LEP1GSC083_2805 [Leptospira interrogans serovar Pyrogenes str. L0374]EMP09640.1 hypothetical protein LEP1GSC124_5096 [Leptospira interrogans serovar Pyrogenes str. 200701872]
MNFKFLVILFVVIFGITTNYFGDSLPKMEQQKKRLNLTNKVWLY